jgi:lipopolysaccharide/colanic/teichoic acid biosynthesis glycosyltransferase
MQDLAKDPQRFALPLHRRNGYSRAFQTCVPGQSYGILSQELFARALYVERKRTERSGRGFVLMLLKSTGLLKPLSSHQALQEVLRALAQSSRETDTIGWHSEGSAIGVIFTEPGADKDAHSVANLLLARVTNALACNLTITQIDQIRLSVHVFPEDWDKGSPVKGTESIFDSLIYETRLKWLSRLVKRLIDIVGSVLALIVGLPLFIGVAIAIKLTSNGPVLFCQQRVGQYGRKFNFLKFRSMHVNNDATIHREFVTRLIANGNGGSPTPESLSPYKLTADPRVTPIGRLLRTTSLDELPQFLNVLMGDMSLVGPRPPIPYEVERYRPWHRTRLLATKPGITGLWQVGGRSRVKFDDMVRMDLRYAASWSLWLDIKILLKTPLAVFSTKGAH